MKIKKEYEFTHNRQLWRIIPTATGKVILEERDTELKEAYFNCLEMNKGKIIFENLQLDEKFWIGIEGVYTDIIFFHKYLKPDMPAHKGVIALDINSRSVLWENTEYNFLFIADKKLYCYKSFFEGKRYFVLDFLTGVPIKDFGDDYSEISRIKEGVSGENEENDYIFPEPFDENKSSDPLLLNKINREKIAAGKIQTARFGDLLFLHTLENTRRGVRNIFKVIEIPTGKIILEETINKEIEKFLPETFFIKGSLLFLLKEKDTLVVYSLKQ
ncbi:MAG TPA: DUF4905 domain-containing protein [Ignavibacteriaceae bacterium]|nr:DUF4905 domain-containing protein [Ignavibacteriaceae bacterium]